MKIAGKTKDYVNGYKAGYRNGAAAVRANAKYSFAELAEHAYRNALANGTLDSAKTVGRAATRDGMIRRQLVAIGDALRNLRGVIDCSDGDALAAEAAEENLINAGYMAAEGTAEREASCRLLVARRDGICGALATLVMHCMAMSGILGIDIETAVNAVMRYDADGK